MSEDVDVVVVGAGVSGIGVARYLKVDRPRTRFVVLEGREEIGGTWSLFRFPGIRSDSDLHTFGYAFKPWTHPKAIAPAPAILDYLREVVAENGLAPHLRFGQSVETAAWSSAEQRWTVTTAAGDTFTARFLVSGTGYYDYRGGYAPAFPGEEDFAGTVVHPQDWPEDLDHAGKRVVIIGSGATAATLVPAMAETAAQVTMLQRTPSYMISLPSEDPIANGLNRLIGPERAYRVTRRKNVFMQRAIFRLARRYPKAVRKLFMGHVRHRLPKGYDVDTHFNPPYDPWQQRLCVLPDGDLFDAVASGRAAVVTDAIERFTAAGIRLRSGRELPADVIVTATGLNMKAFGHVEVSVDGEPVHWPDRTIFKSMMVDGVPNFAYVFGYSNASWTLKVDLVCRHFCRLLDHMDATGATSFVAELDDPAMERLPLMDLSSGYVQRGIAGFPRAGTRGSWTAEMAFEQDEARLLHGPVTDPALRFERAPVATAA